jgi:hypothetical protein
MEQGITNEAWACPVFPDIVINDEPASRQQHRSPESAIGINTIKPVIAINMNNSGPLGIVSGPIFHRAHPGLALIGFGRSLRRLAQIV